MLDGGTVPGGLGRRVERLDIERRGDGLVARNSGGQEPLDRRAVGTGYVEHPDAGVAFIGSGRFELEIAGERYPAAASLRAWYDPAGDRMRG